MAETEFKRLARDMAGQEGLAGSTVLFSIIGFIVLSFIWASLAELDNVTRGEGRVISSVQNQMVQAAEGGVILRRYVSENTIVEEGEVLFEIDPVDASSEYDGDRSTSFIGDIHVLPEIINDADAANSSQHTTVAALVEKVVMPKFSWANNATALPRKEAKSLLEIQMEELSAKKKNSSA